MNLQNFISQAFREIIEGVKEAQVHASEAQAAINPKGLIYLPQSSGRAQHRETSRIAQEIEFDLAVDATEEKGKEGGAGVSVLTFQIGGKGHSVSETRSMNRLKFAIPVIFPKMEYKED